MLLDSLDFEFIAMHAEFATTTENDMRLVLYLFGVQDGNLLLWQISVCTAVVTSQLPCQILQCHACRRPDCNCLGMMGMYA